MSIDAVRTIYEGGWEKPVGYRAFMNFGVPPMFALGTKREHNARRRILAPAYSKSTVCGARIQSIIRSRVASFTDFLKQQARASKGGRTSSLTPRNVIRAVGVDMFTAFAFDETVGTSFTQRLTPGPNTMQQLGMEDLSLWCEDTRESFFFFEREPEFSRWTRLLAPHARSIHHRFESFITNIISHLRIKESLSPESSPYARLCGWQDAATARRLTPRERASEILDHMGAGFDPIPCTIEAIIAAMIAHPHLQDRLRQELQDHLSRVGGCCDQPSFAQIDALPYLNAIIMEALRTVNSIETYQPRLVPKGGSTLCGYYLPEGTIVSTQPYLVHNHPVLFASPEMFDPERWLRGGREGYLNLSKNLFTFSRGPRACLGREYAMCVIKTILIGIFTDFRVEAPLRGKEYNFGDEAGKYEAIFSRVEPPMKREGVVAEVVSTIEEGSVTQEIDVAAFPGLSEERDKKFVQISVQEIHMRV